MSGSHRDRFSEFQEWRRHPLSKSHWDRFSEFQEWQARLLAYRDAYHALKRSDPGAAAGLPDPDSDPHAFDLGDAEARLRAILETR